MVDIPDFRSAIREAARVLEPGGHFLIANLSFVTASPDQMHFPQITGWVRDEHGKRIYRPVDNYIQERYQVFEWGGMKIRNWHRPLSAYMKAYLEAGLALRDFLEPAPATDEYRDDPRLEDWYRVPEFTVMRWQKP
jgi:ubiquinone/menaquinone biosynthesis C-methylase UbiE